jgi:hypothetical protein
VRRHSKAIVATFASMLLTCAFGVTSAIAAPPVVTIGPVSEVSYASAHLSGTIEADESFTFFFFQYSADPAGEGWTSTSFGGPVEFGVGPVNVSSDITGLKPGVEYQARLVAERSGILTTSAEPNATFTTLISAPDVVTGAANDVTASAATLHGNIDPHGQQTTYYFEYGLDNEYGTRVPLNHDEVAGSGAKPVHVEQQIVGLQSGGEYHYRLTAVNPTGTAHGADEVFTTVAPGGPARSYEMVSPVDKGGSNIDVESTSNYQSSPDGNRLVFSTKTALSGPVDTEAGPLLPKYATARDATGWSAPMAIDPPQIPGSPSPKLYTTFAVSEDGSRALVGSLKALAPGASDGDSNLYLRDIPAGTFTTIGTSPGPFFDRDSHFPVNGLYVGGTPDFSSVVVSGMGSSLLPGTPAGSLYEWTGTELRLVSIQPNGEPFPGTSNGGALSQREPHDVSEDGSKVFFNNSGEGYLRKDGQTTVALGGYYKGASRDGSIAFYDREDTLYRLDVEAETSTFVSPNVEMTEGVYQVSEDGDYVYFRSRTALTPDAPAEATKIYVWHEGQTDYIAALNEGREFNLGEYLASPSGRYFAFSAYTQLTSYDNSSAACKDTILGDPGTACKEAYRYDADTGELTCASCRLDNGRPTGNAHIGNIVFSEFSRHFPRSMLDNGELLFDTPDSLSALDTNSRRDVYSFDGREATLISAGRGDGDSQLADASADGENIFFTTEDQLVGQDIDTLTDVYDARVGGGLASQNPPPARGECIRDDCKATPGAGPELPFGGSEGLTGPGNVKAPNKRCAKGQHRVKKQGKVRCVKQKKRHGNRRHGR